MKKSIFRHILNEEYIEVNKSVSETIQCLREQNGLCRNSTNDMTVYFECSEHGKIRVDSMFERHIDFRGILQIYYVRGEVASINNKTYVIITSFYKKSDLWLRSLLLVFAALLFPWWAFIKGAFFIPAMLISFAIFLTLSFCSVNTTIKRKQQGLNIVKTMEDEIKRRVQNIARWDE
ncbi:MAG: hypothetical protein IJF58_05080 [Clostridia bacterium]|nr:hypothetical protein [Clostridia bacterium]